ncbi:hypothetical protein C0Q70_05553 [Pomacea canaliculata]|uniref:Uncharacterized protein n=1 Tax=Pomacea canaliculata TaxID=400727 RepID=A0A2T7PLK8_POMCA|nr:hypothetical protein C0Q70_05553 [Pomacea canaliculata]
MSHGWCRLNLRQEVLEVDALMSAMLYEEMLASRNGISPLNVIPFPHLSANLAKDYLAEQESTLRKFHARLLNFSANNTRIVVSNEE